MKGPVYFMPGRCLVLFRRERCGTSVRIVWPSAKCYVRPFFWGEFYIGDVAEVCGRETYPSKYKVSGVRSPDREVTAEP